ncbi:Hypothetical predicted protein, partial [Olea europaea subsp. europaea]
MIAEESIQVHVVTVGDQLKVYLSPSQLSSLPIREASERCLFLLGSFNVTYTFVFGWSRPSERANTT